MEIHLSDVRQTLQERVVALLDEAVASGPAVEMTSQDWEDIRRQVRERRSIPEKQTHAPNR
jgi:hypothetical protein